MSGIFNRSSGLSIDELLQTGPLFVQKVAEGKIPGYAIVHKFGHNPDVDTGSVPETIWTPGGLYVWQSTAQPLNIQSSSASDSATGAGARSILVLGLDANLSEISEEVTLQGTTTVQTTQSFLRCFRAYVTSVGTYHGTNIGNITGTFATTSDTAFRIDAAQGQTQMALYTVPIGKTGYILSYDISIDSRRAANLTLRHYDGEANNVAPPFEGASRILWQFEGVTQRYVSNLMYPNRLPGGSDIWWQVDEVDAKNTSISVNFEILLVDDDIL